MGAEVLFTSDSDGEVEVILALPDFDGLLKVTFLVVIGQDRYLSLLIIIVAQLEEAVNRNRKQDEKGA